MTARLLNGKALAERLRDGFRGRVNDLFFYGLRDGEETAVEIDRGKTLFMRLLGHSALDPEGVCKLFFELNGQPRLIRVEMAGLAPRAASRPKAEEGNPRHIGTDVRNHRHGRHRGRPEVGPWRQDCLARGNEDGDGGTC